MFIWILHVIKFVDIKSLPAIFIYWHNGKGPLRYFKNYFSLFFVSFDVVEWNNYETKTRELALQVVPKFLGNYHKKSEMECNFTLRVLTARRQTPWIHLVFWCGNSVETRNFRRVLGESLFSQNSRVSTKFPQQEIRWNFGIWSSLAYCILNGSKRK